MDFFTSIRGSRKLKYQEFIYCKNKTLTNGNTYWECSERRSGNRCRSKLTIDREGENIVVQPGQHSHAPDPGRNNAEILRSTMKREARTSEARTNTIVARNIVDIDEGAMANLPRLETMRRDVRRQRQTNQELPPVPVPFNTMFEIPDNITMTANGNFLQYDNRLEDRILIFGTPASLNYLSHSEHWFMDGTFSTAPPQFAQLYTVHGYRDGRNVVGAYCLLPNKTLNTYLHTLNQLRLLTNNRNPQSIMIDFETAMKSALEQTFPEATVKGCLFHLCKIIYRKVQSEGLQELYTNDENFRMNIKMIGALSFVPIEDTIQAFDALSDYAGEESQVILDFFETNYIGELRRGRRLEPRFPHSMWNVNRRVENGLARTNNDLEGWHNGFAGFFHGNHENIWKCIIALKKDAAINQHKMTQNLIGAPVPLQRPVYRRVNENLQTLIMNYQFENILDFLHGVSYNLSSY
jgi:hypothetical protein